jgi:hypothetical protein
MLRPVQPEPEEPCFSVATSVMYASTSFWINSSTAGREGSESVGVAAVGGGVRPGVGAVDRTPESRLQLVGV